MTRKLVAALACRSGGTRLYGKPLQNLDVKAGVTILDHMVALLRTVPAISETVLGISEGDENLAYVHVARKHGLAHIIGDQRDVLQRLLQCAAKAHATDVFRVTTESPFFHYELIDEAWRRHVAAGNDVTTCDGLPEGSHFEIYTVEALQRSWDRGNERHRSEGCSRYIREHRADFQVEVLPIPKELERLDLRLTVDWPEDLVLCRRVYEHHKDLAPRIPVASIVDFLDRNPALKALVQPYVVPQRLW